MRNGQRIAYVSDAVFRQAVAPGGSGLDALAKASGTTPDRLAVRAAFTAEIAKAEGEGADRAIDIVISTETPDRDRDIISVDGWDLRAYRRNSVVLFAHDYHSLPIARGENVRAEDGKLKATATFVPADIYPFAETVYQMLAGGWMSAASVGFRPLEWNYNEERRGVDFNRQELLEFSFVPVPSNAEALIEARGAGVDVQPLQEWAEKTLDWLAGHASKGAPPPDTEPVDGLKPFANEHACRLKAPGQFSEFRRGSRTHEGKSYGVIFGRKGDTWLEQAYRYPKDVWSPAEAKKHWADHDGLSFEPAAGEIAAPSDKRIAKRGRVLSAANERRLRAAGAAADQAAAKIAEVVAQVEQAPEADEQEAAPAAIARDAAPADVADTFDLDTIPYDTERDALSELTAEDVLAALRSSIGADVATGVRRALNGALGRVD